MVIPTIQIPPIIFNDFVLDAVEDESVMVFGARVELNSQSAITGPPSDLNQKATQHICIVYPAVLR